MEGKVFRLSLVDTDYFDDVRDYLKKLKHLKYGLAVYSETEREFKIIYFLVKYGKKKALNTDRLHHCRIRKGPIAIKTLIKHYKGIGEVLWEEGEHEAFEIAERQKKIDDYLISNEITITLK